MQGYVREELERFGEPPIEDRTAQRDRVLKMLSDNARDEAHVVEPPGVYSAGIPSTLSRPGCRPPGARLEEHLLRMARNETVKPLPPNRTVQQVENHTSSRKPSPTA